MTKEHVSEITEFDSLETETEKLNDATSTERFQMQTEIAQMQHEDNKTNLDVKASYGGGDTKIEANYGNATATSREDSNKQAITTAKELTNRAMERILTKVKKERTVKVTDRLTEVSKQGFDNRGSAEHVSGVYRYINAIYKNEIENYGRRLAYEFAIPEPSRLHNLAMSDENNKDHLVGLKKPEDPRNIFTWEQIKKDSYENYAQKYQADVTFFPEEKRVLRGLLSTPNTLGTVASVNGNIEIPEGFEISKVGYSYQGVAGYDHSNLMPNIEFKVGNSLIPKFSPPVRAMIQMGYTEIPSYAIDHSNESTVITSAEVMDCYSFDLTTIVEVIIKQNVITKWQKEVYKQIIAAYEERLKEYNDKVATIKEEAKEAFETNPLNFRQIEHKILRMNCISYLIAPYGQMEHRNFGKEMYAPNSKDGSQAFESTRVDRSDTSRLDEYAAFIKFMEQAFEWNIMSYNFYPFYWGSYSNWKQLYQADYNDPIFTNFMQAGMARVVVTVRQGFENAVLLYMKTGKIWANGHVPVYGDPLYVSMVNELKDPPYKIDDDWETILPTNLLALQKSGAVINAHGLPNFEEPESVTNDNFERTDDKMNPIIKKDERVLVGEKKGFWAWLFGE